MYDISYVRGNSSLRRKSMENRVSGSCGIFREPESAMLIELYRNFRREFNGNEIWTCLFCNKCKYGGKFDLFLYAESR